MVGDPHENFFNNVAADVGKRTDDPSTRFYRYSEYRISNVETASGNIEYEYDWGTFCITYYEVNPTTQIIVSWRKHEKHTSSCRNGG